MKHNESSHSNFWLGFVLGAGATTAGMYLFGTTKGRKQLRSALDLTENLESTVEDVYHAVLKTYSDTDAFRNEPGVIDTEEYKQANDSSSVGPAKLFSLLKLFSTNYLRRKHGKGY